MECTAKKMKRSINSARAVFYHLFFLTYNALFLNSNYLSTSAVCSSCCDVRWMIEACHFRCWQKPTLSNQRMIAFVESSHLCFNNPNMWLMKLTRNMRLVLMFLGSCTPLERRERDILPPLCRY